MKARLIHWHRRWLPRLLVILIAFATGKAPVLAQTSPVTVGVYYVGPEDVIAEAINRGTPYLVRVDQPDLAQVIVINNAPLRDTLQVFGNEIQGGRLGLVLFSGPLFPQSVDDLRNLLGVSTFGLDQVAEPAAVQTAVAEDAIAEAITWRSAPEIQARTLIDNPNLLRTIITTETEQPLIQRVRGRDETQILIVGGWLNHPSNAQWPAWAYFDYLIYRLITDAAGLRRPLSFVNYPPSPTPQPTERIVILLIGLALILGTAAIYYTARRRLYLNPQLADAWRRLTARPAQTNTPDVWREVGFHRPLGGLLAFLPVSLLLFVPAVAFVLHLLPNVIFTSAEGLKSWTLVTNGTMAFWVLLDAGTGIAAVRYFAARQIHFPHQAARYLQFYVWWQFVSGGLQIGVMCMLIAVVLPTSGWAHLAYYLLARTALQFPGFLSVFALSFRARQRLDHEQVLNVVRLVSVPLFQAGLILALTSWRQALRGITPALVGALGLAGGLVAGEAIAFGLGAYLHHRTGHPLRSLFLPTFDNTTSSEMLKFGVPWALGATVPLVGFLIQSSFFGTTLMPADPSLSIRDWRLITLSAAGFDILLLGLYRGLMPALTEALTVNARSLLRYYVSQGIRYGAWASFFLFAALGALSEQGLRDIFGVTYDAVPWLMLLLAWGALHWTTWLPDRALEAVGRPGIIIWLALTEQIVRIGGGLVLGRLWGTWGLMLAYCAASLVRAILARTAMRAYVIRARIYVWQSLIATAGAALLIHRLVRALMGRWAQPSWTGNSLVAMGLLPAALCAYGFLTALLGGWDDGSLAELRRAVRISGIGYPIAWALLLSVRLGAGISPLHNRFPIALYGVAQEEARALSFAQFSSE